MFTIRRDILGQTFGYDLGRDKWVLDPAHTTRFDHLYQAAQVIRERRLGNTAQIAKEPDADNKRTD